MLFFSLLAAAAPPVHVGTSVSAGAAVHGQQGVVEAMPGLDLLDVELAVGRGRVVVRGGRFLVGRFALQITELDVAAFLRLTDDPADGWTRHASVGLEPRLIHGASQTAVGLRALGRLGLERRPGRRTDLVFLEPFVGVDRGPELLAVDAGLRIGYAPTWRIGG